MGRFLSGSARASSQNRPTVRLGVERLEDRLVPAADVVTEWSTTVVNFINSAAVDQGHAGRAEAMASLAVYNAVNAIERTGESYHFNVTAPRTASESAAAAQAAHDVLASVFQNNHYSVNASATQLAAWDAQLAADLQAVPAGTSKDQGVAVGKAAAASMLALRANDHADDAPVPYVFGTGPLDYQPTPDKNGNPIAQPILTQWRYVTPFALTSAAQFLPPPPLQPGDPGFQTQLDEVRSLGGKTSTTRTADQTDIAKFWAEASVSMWNRLGVNLATQDNNSLADHARMFGLLDMTIADATISQFNTKYTYDFIRPVTYINENLDPTWAPLLTTPAHPSYESGHVNTGTAAGVVLQSFYGDNISLDQTSLTSGTTRHLGSITQAMEQNAESRVFGGIHWRFDQTESAVTGAFTGDYVLGNFLREGRHHGGHDGFGAAVSEFLFDVTSYALPRVTALVPDFTQAIEFEFNTLNLLNPVVQHFDGVRSSSFGGFGGHTHHAEPGDLFTGLTDVFAS